MEGFVPIRYEREVSAGQIPSVWYSELRLRQAGGEGSSGEGGPDDEIPPLAVWSEGVGWRLASAEPHDGASDAPVGNGVEAQPEGTSPPDYTPYLIPRHRVQAYPRLRFNGLTRTSWTRQWRNAIGHCPWGFANPNPPRSSCVTYNHYPSPWPFNDEEWEEDPHRTDSSGIDPY